MNSFIIRFQHAIDLMNPPLFIGFDVMLLKNALFFLNDDVYDSIRLLSEGTLYLC